jgi:hypothetical protein
MNELLLWVSAIGSGGDAAFRRRATELLPARRAGPSAYSRALWSLGSLAHCEFGEAAGGGWRVAPPVIAAGDPAGPVSGVLCGARSAPLIARLAAAAGDCMSVAAQRDGPDLVVLSLPTAGDLIRASREAGIPVQWNAPLAILSAFVPPPLASFEDGPVPSGGWAVERFSRSRMVWLSSSVAEAGRSRRGLFRFRSDYDVRHIYRQGSATRHVPPGIAKYWAIGRRQRAMRLDLSRGQVSFPLAARPPGLIDRALVVASGTLPVPSNGRLTYSGIAAPVAAATAAALHAIAMGADT